jgi:ankyrin repeat protein
MHLVVNNMFRMLFLLTLVAGSISNAATIDEQMFAAAKNGDSAEIRKLVTEGADVNARGPHGGTPLLTATNYNRLDAVKTLLELGADVKYQVGGMSALFTAVGRDTEIVRVLIEAGADVNLVIEKYNYSPLGKAAGNRDETFQRLTENAGYRGPFPNHVETVRLLIKAGANVNHVDSHKRSPLRTAMEANNKEIARLLLEAGADVHQRLSKEWVAGGLIDTILMTTVSYYSVHKDISAISLLLNFGANPNDGNEMEYDKYCEWRGGCDWRGYSVLTYAAKRGWYEVVKLLLDRGADPLITRTDGKSAVELARENKHPRTAALIEQRLKAKQKVP